MSLDCVLTPSATEKLSYFLPGELEKINPSHMPHHIAIIPDGNRRWAKKNFSETHKGHHEGANTLMDIVKAAQELKIKMITFYAFSTENWSRPQEEVIGLMMIFSNYLLEQKDEMIRFGIKLETIGDLTRLSPLLNKIIEDTKAATNHCNSMQLILAFNYGSRDELARACKSMFQDYSNKQLSIDDINEETISRYLDTRQWQDPDLLIRTSGEVRVSNFLLWQISYAEIYISPVLWPEFSPSNLLDAVIDYQTRNRRGGI